MYPLLLRMRRPSSLTRNAKTFESFDPKYSTHHAPFKQSQRSQHARWYADTVPSMIPVAILGSAVYLGLQLAQSYLSHEKYMDEALARVGVLEEQIKHLESQPSASSSIPNAEKSSKSKSWFG